MRRTRKIVFLVDFGSEFGLGHWFRSLNLAQAFLAKGFAVRVLVNCKAQSIKHAFLQAAPVLIEYFSWENFAAQYLVNFENCLLVVDSYQASKQLLEKCAMNNKLLIFDDYNRCPYPKEAYICNGIPNNNYSKQAQEYVLNGFDYQIIRPVFTNSSYIVRDSVKNIFCSFGGADERQLAASFLPIIRSVFSEQTIHYIQGTAVKEPPRVDKLRTYNGLVALSMAELMQHCDFAISSAGQSLLELLALGIPSLAMANYLNQFYLVQELGARKLCLAVFQPSLSELKALLIQEKLNIESTRYRRQLSIASKGLIKADASIKIINYLIARKELYDA